MAAELASWGSGRGCSIVGRRGKTALDEMGTEIGGLSVSNYWLFLVDLF